MRAAGVLAVALLGAALAWAGPAGPQPAPTRLVSVAVAGSPERATGFSVGAGRVVTVAHVLERGGAVSVRAGRGPARRARVLRLDPRSDLALLRVPSLRAPELPVERAGADSPARMLVLRARRAVDAPARVRRSIVAHVRGPGADRALRRPALELEARPRAGDSGAPLVTDGGALAGVLFARSRTRARTAYAVDAIAVERLARR
jgi:S1-C subfamily serine protease